MVKALSGNALRLNLCQISVNIGVQYSGERADYNKIGTRISEPIRTPQDWKGIKSIDTLGDDIGCPPLGDGLKIEPVEHPHI